MIIKVNAVTRAGWGKDRDLGYTIIEATSTGNARLVNILAINFLVLGTGGTIYELTCYFKYRRLHINRTLSRCSYHRYSSCSRSSCL